MADAKVVEWFLKSVAGHRVDVLLDAGLDRRVRCASPGSSILGFEIVSWPGCLAVSGDMGTYVFARSDDMFDMFRGKLGGYVDFDYAAEKCVAADKRFGLRRFSGARFSSCLDDQIDNVVEEFSLSDADAGRLRRELADVFPPGWADDYLEPDREGEARRRLDAFVFATSDGVRVWFSGRFRPVMTELDDRFKWIVLAVCWAVSGYDEAKKGNA